MLDYFRYGQHQLVFEWAANHLYTDRQSFVRMANWKGDPREAGQVEPLRKPHGVAVARAGRIISLAVMKRGIRRNW